MKWAKRKAVVDVSLFESDLEYLRERGVCVSRFVREMVHTSIRINDERPIRRVLWASDSKRKSAAFASYLLSFVSAQDVAHCFAVTPDTVQGWLRNGCPYDLAERLYLFALSRGVYAVETYFQISRNV